MSIIKDDDNFDDPSPPHLEIIIKVDPYSCTGKWRLTALLRLTDYILSHGILGCIAECGVWKGGSMMAVAAEILAAQRWQKPTIPLILFDTFAGMSRPTAGKDGPLALGEADDPSYAVSLVEVQRNMLSTGYPAELITFVEGDVVATLPRASPDKIALLRLDTDFYESTYHELTHLYPRIVEGGILLIDDYGHWEGCREATDQYFREQGIKPDLKRIDYTGRYLVKPAIADKEAKMLRSGGMD